MPLPVNPCSGWSAHDIVAAFIELTTVRQFYYGLALIFFAILCWRPPWRCRRCRGAGA